MNAVAKFSRNLIHRFVPIFRTQTTQPTAAMIPTMDPVTPTNGPNPDHLSLPANDSGQDEVTGHYREVVGNLFDSEDSLGHCVSADFKMSAGIARKIRRNYP